jgi:hypothetical protein
VRYLAKSLFSGVPKSVAQALLLLAVIFVQRESFFVAAAFSS